MSSEIPLCNRCIPFVLSERVRTHSSFQAGALVSCFDEIFLKDVADSRTRQLLIARVLEKRPYRTVQGDQNDVPVCDRVEAGPSFPSKAPLTFCDLSPIGGAARVDPTARRQLKDNSSKLWRILAFIFGLHGTIVTFFAVKEGTTARIGLTCPKGQVISVTTFRFQPRTQRLV